MGSLPNILLYTALKCRYHTCRYRFGRRYRNQGSGVFNSLESAPNAIRRQLYQLHFWHKDVSIADIGNIKTGATLADSYAAVKAVLAELIRMNKTVVILGGSHDITLAQYYAYVELHQVVEATCIDATLLKGRSPERSENF